MSTQGQPDRDESPKVVPIKSLLKLCTLLFKEFCREREIEEDQVHAVSPVPFLSWLREKAVTLSADDAISYWQQAEVGEVVWHALLDMAHDPMGANQLQTVWLAVTLADRPKPAVRVESIHVISLIKWQDGKAMPLSSLVPRELVNNAHLIDDAVACTSIQMQSASLVEVLRQMGLDHAHDFRADMADEEAFEVLMGLLLKILQGATIIDPSSGQQLKLGHHMVERCQRVQRLLQAMFRPPIPPEVRAEIEKQRALENDGGAESKTPPSLLVLPGDGGWDQP